MRFYLPLLLLLLSGCSVKKNTATLFESSDIDRIVKTLASNEMEGRASFSPGIERAADFISSEFEKAGVQPLNWSYRQTFSVDSYTPLSVRISFDDAAFNSGQAFFNSRSASFKGNQNDVEVVAINKEDDFMSSYRKYAASDKNLLFLIDPSHHPTFDRIRQYVSRGTVEFAEAKKDLSTKIFVLTEMRPARFSVETATSIEQKELFNVVGTIPGKSKEKEIVVFSAHYDHIGIQKPVGQDSIANGADDDASGVTAVISLAKAYGKKRDNERTLVFVAFTAEEIGGFGSRYFSQQQNVDDIVGMINIEMIGKDSKFGPNSMYVTGFEHSDLGQIMQRGVEGTAFSFHPDPYPEQNLFYRSDNATLAMLGVPAHTFSTVQIVNDQYYHTVKDEYETLNIENIISSIKALYSGSKSLISGEATPSRVKKLER